MSLRLFEPTLPRQALELSPVGQDRLLSRARRELLQRTFTGTFVYPTGALLVAWAVGLLAEHPRAVLGVVAVLTAIVGVRVVLYRRALVDTSRPTLAGRVHLALGIVSATLFSAGVGAGFLARGGDAGITAAYVAMAAIAGGIVMVASTHRRLATVWVISSIVPGLVVFLLRGDQVAQVLIAMYALYVPVLVTMIAKGNDAWWEAQIAAVRLDERAHRMARASRRTGMAENATNVLHDVGNALNAAKTSVDLLVRAAARHPAADLARLLALIHDHRDELPAFIASDGPKLLRFLEVLSVAAGEHEVSTSAEATRVQATLLHIEAIVSRQQEVARDIGGSEPCSVVELVHAAVGLSRAVRLDVGVELDEAVQRGATVDVDKPRVLQILVNLLENACDAMAGRGTTGITVRAREEVDAVVIEVADLGHGIAPEVAAQIFTRGFTTKPHGHGFGLHGSFALAQAMGGALSFESAGLGRGAVFRLRLPLAKAAQPHAA